MPSSKLVRFPLRVTSRASPCSREPPLSMLFTPTSAGGAAVNESSIRSTASALAARSRHLPEGACPSECSPPSSPPKEGVPPPRPCRLDWPPLHAVTSDSAVSPVPIEMRRAWSGRYGAAVTEWPLRSGRYGGGCAGGTLAVRIRGKSARGSGWSG